MRNAWTTYVISCAVLATIACGESTAPAPPAVLLTAVTAQQQVASPIQMVGEVPAVRATSFTDSSPLPGLKVTFTRYTPDGAASTTVATTDNNGIARLESWRMASVPGFYRVDAYVDKATPVAFRAYVPGTILERFYANPSDERPVLVTAIGGGYFWGDDTTRYPDGNYARSNLGSYALYVDPLAENARFFLASQYLMYDGSAKGDTLTLNRALNLDGGWPPLVLLKRSQQFVPPVTDDQVVESYDLRTIGGHDLPQIYSGGGSSWQVTGGRYDLLADGTYYFYYIMEPSRQNIPTHPTGYYTRSAAGTIEFYTTGPMGPFYAERGGHFSTGVLSGSTMTVHYEDPVDFDVEVYSRRK